MKYSYDSNFFEKIDSEAKAYWLGFLYADGYIHRNYKNGKIKSMSLELSLKSEDRAHLENFLRDIRSNVPIKDKVIKLNDKKYFANRIKSFEEAKEFRFCKEILTKSKRTAVLSRNT